MKLFIQTAFTTQTLDDGDIRRVPDLGGHEANELVKYSAIEMDNDSCVCRVAFPQSLRDDIEASGTPLTDSEALQRISKQNPNIGLENIDASDPEIDAELEFVGLDPMEVRRDIVIPSRGERVLQDQEYHAMVSALQTKGVTGHEDLPKSGHHDKPDELSEDINSFLDGNNIDHRAMLDHLKNDRPFPPWTIKDD